MRNADQTLGHRSLTVGPAYQPLAWNLRARQSAERQDALAERYAAQTAAQSRRAARAAARDAKRFMPDMPNDRELVSQLLSRTPSF